MDELRFALGRRAVLSAAALCVACACTQAPSPVQRTEPAEAPATTDATAVTEAPAEATAAGAATGPKAANPPTYLPVPAEDGSKDVPAAQRPGVVVLDPGEDARPKTLVEAARAERERRAHAGKPVAVITDKTLPKLATGQLTYAQPKTAEAGAAPAPATAGGKGEAYWRDRAREIRTRWRHSLDEIERLEQSAADLRRRFYAEDDPYRRDGQIKPDWDRALDRLAREHEEAKAAQRELAEFLEEGRRDGALPGWLREGSDLEPPPAPEEASAGQAVEPPELEDYAVEPSELGIDPLESPPA